MFVRPICPIYDCHGAILSLQYLSQFQNNRISQQDPFLPNFLSYQSDHFIIVLGMFVFMTKNLNQIFLKNVFAAFRFILIIWTGLELSLAIMTE